MTIDNQIKQWASIVSESECQFCEGFDEAKITWEDGTTETVENIHSIESFIQWFDNYKNSNPEGDIPNLKSVVINNKEYTSEDIVNIEDKQNLNEVSTGHRNDEDPSTTGKPNLNDYRKQVKSGEIYGVKDIGDEMELFINALKETNNWENVLERMDVDQVATIFGTILDNVDDREFQEAYGTLLEESKNVDSTNEGQSKDYEKARKIGYLGDNDEAKVEDWLKGNYAKWKQSVYDTFMKIANGDEEKAQDWFDRYDDLATQMVGIQKWSEKKNGYVSQKEVKQELENELGDSPEAKELMDKLEQKWKADAKEIQRFYDTSSSRGGWTGD